MEKVDPVIVDFLDFLEEDIKENPQRLKPVSQELVAEVKSLVDRMDIDLDESLPEE